MHKPPQPHPEVSAGCGRAGTAGTYMADGETLATVGATVDGDSLHYSVFIHA